MKPTAKPTEAIKGALDLKRFGDGSWRNQDIALELALHDTWATGYLRRDLIFLVAIRAPFMVYQCLLVVVVVVGSGLEGTVLSLEA